MILPIARTVRRRNPDNTLSEPSGFDAYKDLRAWVLLGDPGAGKTKTFEVLATQEGGQYVRASDFLDITSPDGYGTPLFIDALDEATALEGKSPLGRIRSKLSELRIQTFRISCREADWRGTTDSSALQQLVEEGQFAELHLAPLDAEQARRFAGYWLKSNEAKAMAFVREAERRDLDGLLTNPQTLRMLIEAVGSKSDEWPSSKKEVYQKACSKLVQEQNQVHQDTQRDTSLTDAQLLEAAAYLCAVMLLSGSSSIALGRSNATQTHTLELNMLSADKAASPPNLQACQAALRTHLFGSNGAGDFIPVHRTVAEYLGATYLAERIRAHLPANRVLALIQGEEGGVVPELRGLHAWLATASSNHVRKTLIEHDALGLVLHGDVRDFSVTEKKHILHALQREAERYVHFRSQNWASHPFGALATEDMQDTFRTWLQSSDRTPPHQAVLDCVLDAMTHGQAMPELDSNLEQLVRDKRYLPEIRRSALTVLCTHSEKSRDWAAPQRLLEAIKKQEVQDADDALLGVLLRSLYPVIITPQTIWGYYKPSFLISSSSQWEFWHNLGTRYTPRESLPSLMDALVSTDIRLQSNGDDYFLSSLIGDTLLEAITNFGEQSETSRLYAWLKLGMGVYQDNGLEEEKRQAVGRWIAERPKIYKALFEYGISSQEHSQKSEDLWLYEVKNTLCEAAPPTDAADWYLALAKDRNSKLRQLLIAEAFLLIGRREGENSQLECMEFWANAHPEDSEWIAQGWMSCPYPPDEVHQGLIRRGLERKQRDAQERSEELAFLRKELPLLTSQEPHNGLLIHLGHHYLRDTRTSSDQTPKKSLLTYLNNDPHWVDMALVGLRQYLDKVDIPDVTRIFDSYINSRRFSIADPCLAAMHLRFSEAPTSAFDLPASLLEKLIAFFLTSHHGNTPAWFSELLQTQPDLVAPVMKQLMRMQISAKAEHVQYLHALAHDEKYKTLAQKITPELIEALPEKAGKAQLRSVRQLIVCLLRVLASPLQQSLIAQKLAISKMDVAQRVYWLCAGAQVSPELYLEMLKSYLGNNQSRAAHANALLQEQRQERYDPDLLTLDVKAFFVELLGARFTPAEESSTGEAYMVTPAMESMRFVQQLITSIGRNPSEDARLALENLELNHALSPWTVVIQHAIYEQKILRRKALFKPASVLEVCQTLANLQPANAADLHALVLDHLKQLAHEIRNGNTNDYTQYWDSDKPKIENDCRNALLSDLKKHLHPLGVNAEPEGNYADHKRADIKVLYGTYQIPIEIKRDAHKDLWKAIHEQLIAKYSRESSSDGYGIYIVFWFSHTPMPVAGDGGNRPKTPQELQQRLAATVPNTHKGKISVLVIDCAQPLRAQ